MDNILHLSNLVFDIKDKITDNEFMNIMDSLSKINKGNLIEHNAFCCLTTVIEGEIEDTVSTTFYLNVNLPERVNHIHDIDWEPNFLIQKLIEKKGNISMEEIPYMHRCYDRHRNHVIQHSNLQPFCLIGGTTLEFLSVCPEDNV